MAKKLCALLLCIFVAYSSTYRVAADIQSDYESENNVSQYFQIDSFTITLEGKAVYDNGADPDFTIKARTAPDIRFNITWSEINPDIGNFEAGDFIIFKLLTIEGVENATAHNKSQDAPLYDGNVLLATAQLITEVNGTTMEIYYKIIFNENIEGKDSIHGSLTGGLFYSGMSDDDQADLYYDGEHIATVGLLDDDEPVDDDRPIYIEDTEIGNTIKSLYHLNKNAGEIMWELKITDYVENQFEDYLDGYQESSYNYKIVDDILDPYQTFFNANGGLIYAAIYAPIFLYSEDFSKSEAYDFLYQHEFYLNNVMTRINTEGMTNAEIREAVEATPRTYALIMEENASGDSYEHLVMNFGAPGNGGIMFHELLGNNYGELISNMTTQRDAVQKLVNDYAGEQDDCVIEGANNKTATLGEWKEQLEMLDASIVFYTKDANGNTPYIYDFNVYLVTKVDIDMVIPLGINSVSNTMIVSDGTVTHDNTAYSTKFWTNEIRASAVLGDVVVYKVNTLYENGTISGDMDVNGPVEGVGFAVLNSNGDQIYFTDSDGKYHYDMTGDVETVITDSYGRIILSDLPAGEYALVETQPQDGYYTDNALVEIPFTVSKNLINSVVVENTPRTIDVIKIDSFGNPLEGAEFGLFLCDTPSCETGETLSGYATMTINGVEYYYLDEDGDNSLISNADGIIHIMGLASGYYRLYEIAAPLGYLTTEDSAYFYLSPTLQDQEFTAFEFINMLDLITITGTKTWVDNNDSAGARPDNLELILRANGEIVNLDPIWTKDEANVWTYRYEDLITYDQGQQIIYTVEEVSVTGYTGTQDGYDFVNTYQDSEIDPSEEEIDPSEQETDPPEGEPEPSESELNPSTGDETLPATGSVTYRYGGVLLSFGLLALFESRRSRNKK